MSICTAACISGLSGVPLLILPLIVRRLPLHCYACRLLVNLQHLSAGENNLLEIPAEIGTLLNYNNIVRMK